MSNRRCILSLSCLVLFFLASTTSAFAQLSTGTITGTVQDASGAVIPGVAVSLSSPGVIGGNQQAITNERGGFQFPRLVPGQYSVRAELAGFKTAARENIQINADVTVRIDLSLEVGDVADTVTVTGEAPLLDTTTALNQAVLDRATLDKIPSGHDMWSIGRVVPSLNVTSYDVGGNQSFQQYTMTAHGSSGADNKWAIDGMDVAWAGGAGTVMVYFDPNMFEEINYQVGNISAENRQGGVVMNMVTKTGSNDFHGSFMFTGTNESMQSDNLSPELRTQLLARIPQFVRDANPDIKPGQKIQSLFDTSATLSGPIIRDKFWFTGTYKISSLNQFLLGNYNPNGTQGIDDNRIKNGTFKLSYQTTEASQLHYTYSRNLKHRYHRRTETYQENSAARFQNQWADIHQMKWTSTVSSRIVTDAGVSFQHGPSPYEPKEEALFYANLGMFPKFDNGTSSSTVMNGGYNTQPQYRIASSFNLNYFAGSHDIKIGYQYGRLMLRSKTWSIVDPTKAPLPGPFRARYNNGTPISVDLYNYDVDTRAFLQEHGFFLQDKWNVNRKLTLNLGIRFDALKAWVPELCQPETTWVRGQCFAELKDPEIPKMFDIAPRLSFIYDIFGDGRTAIKGAANIYHEGLASPYPNQLNPYSTATANVPWADGNSDLIPQPNEIGFNFTTKTPTNSSGFNFGSNNFYNPDLKRPFSAEYSIGIQRELAGGFVVSGTYFRRDGWRPIGSENIALDESHFDPIAVTIPQNGQQLTIYNIKSASQSRSNCGGGVGKCMYYSNHSDRGTFFNGVDFTLNKRMSNRWMMMAGLSLNSTQQREAYRRDAPNSNNFRGGPSSNNIPFMFKTSGVYQAPYGFEVAGNFQHFGGTPETMTYQITRSLVPQLTGTSLTVDLAKRGETSKPNVRMIDLSISREFRMAETLRFAPKIEFFNLANAGTITNRSTVLSGTGVNTYLSPSEILAPRMIRMGLQVNF
jgi:hypothetical protein